MIDKLVQSGPTTRGWLAVLRVHLKRFGYSEAKYYASFRSPEKKRSIAQLNPAKKSIRMFVRLEPLAEPNLTITPSTFNYAKYFPSVFTIRTETDLAIAIGLIEQSYEHDLRLPP